MKTWNDYKKNVKKSDAEGRKDMEEVENLSVIIGELIRQRNALDISRRELADTCGASASFLSFPATIRKGIISARFIK